MEVSKTETSADGAVPYLDVSGLEFSYGEVKVLYGLEFQLAPQSIGCVMGRNGVGKTTFLRNLVGLENSSAGKIYIDGSDATKLEAHERACNGIAMFRRVAKFFRSLLSRKICWSLWKLPGQLRNQFPHQSLKLFRSSIR